VKIERRLLEDTAKRIRIHIHRRLSGNCDCAGFQRVLQVPVAAFGANDNPAIVLENPQNLANLHR